MQPSEFKSALTRAHYVIALEGTNNLLFYLATTAGIEDKKMIFPATLSASLGFQPEIRTMYDYRSRYAGIYNRLYQFCVISLCSDIEGFFRSLFLERGYKVGKGAFFQRFDEVLSELALNGYDFSPIDEELKALRLAFQVRHICIHNLGRVDQNFITKTQLSCNVGDLYHVTEADYHLMFSAYTALLRNIDTKLV